MHNLNRGVHALKTNCKVIWIVSTNMNNLSMLRHNVWEIKTSFTCSKWNTYVSKTNIFGLKMMVKTGVEKMFFNSFMHKAYFGPTDLLHKRKSFCPTLQIQ